MGGRAATVGLVVRPTWRAITDGLWGLVGARALRGATLELHRAVWIRRGRGGAANEPMLVVDITIVPAAGDTVEWSPKALEFVAAGAMQAALSVDALRMPSGATVPDRVAGRLRFQAVLRVPGTAPALFARHRGGLLDGAMVVPRDESLSVVLTPPSRDDAKRVLRGHEAPVTSLAALPDGSLLSGDAWGSLRAWRDTVVSAQVGAGTVHALVARPDGTCIASCGELLAIRHAGRASFVALGAHRGREILPVCGLPGARVASGGYDGAVRLWSEAGGTELAVAQFAHPVLALAANADGSVLACGLEDGTLLLLDGQNLDERTRREGAHRGDVYAVAFHPVEDVVVSAGGTDHSLKCWDLALALLRTVDEGVPLSTVVFSGDGALLAEAAGNRVVLRETRGWSERATFEGHASVVSALVFVSNGHELASSSYDGTVRIWSLP